VSRACHLGRAVWLKDSVTCANFLQREVVSDTRTLFMTSQWVIVLENINLLLNEALSPYHVSVGVADALGNHRIAVRDDLGQLMFERSINRNQLNDHGALTDVVDGFHRDLRVAEGRLHPCVIAGLQLGGRAAGVFTAPA
jgi:hypothetical protein